MESADGRPQGITYWVTVDLRNLVQLTGWLDVCLSPADQGNFVPGGRLRVIHVIAAIPACPVHHKCGHSANGPCSWVHVRTIVGRVNRVEEAAGAIEIDKFEQAGWRVQKRIGDARPKQVLLPTFLTMTQRGQCLLRLAASRARKTRALRRVRRNVAATRFTWRRHRRDVRLWVTAPPRVGSRVPACNAACLSTIA